MEISSIKTKRHRGIRWHWLLLTGFVVALLTWMFIYQVEQPQAAQDQVFVLEKRLDLGGVSDIAWHPNNKWVALTFYNRNFIEVWDIDEARLVVRLVKQADIWGRFGQEIAFSPDGERLVALDSDPRETMLAPPALRIRPAAQGWLTEDWSEDKTYLFDVVTSENRPTGICFSSNGKQIYIASYYVLAKFDAETGKRLKQIGIHKPFGESTSEFRPSSMSCNDQTGQIAIGGHRPKYPVGQRPSREELYASPHVPILIYDQADLRLSHHFKAHTTYIKLMFSGDGKWLFSDPNRNITSRKIGKEWASLVAKEPPYVWNSQSWEKSYELVQYPFKNKGLDFYRRVKPIGTIEKSSYLLVSVQGSLRFWNLATGEFAGRAPVSGFAGAALSNDGSRALIAGSDGDLVYKINTAALLVTQ